MRIKGGTFRRYMNGREVKKFYGLLHRQFQAAEQAFYDKNHDWNKDVDLVVKQVGLDVEFHATNKRLEPKWLGN